jgi:hypothetical protein
MKVHQLGGGFVANGFAASADVDLGAELQKAPGHRLAETGATTRYKNASPGEKLIVEHRFHPRRLSVNWSID